MIRIELSMIPLVSLTTTATLICMGLTGPQAQAAQEGPSVNVPVSMMHPGKIVSVAADKLVMSDRDGKNKQTFSVTSTARILLDGKSSPLNDLRAGDRVTVTVTAEGVVTLIEATRSAPTQS